MPILSEIVEFFEHDFSDIICHSNAFRITVVEHDESPRGSRPVLNEFSGFSTNCIRILFWQCSLNVNSGQKTHFSGKSFTEFSKSVCLRLLQIENISPNVNKKRNKVVDTSATVE